MMSSTKVTKAQAKPVAAIEQLKPEELRLIVGAGVRKNQWYDKQVNR